MMPTILVEKGAASLPASTVGPETGSDAAGAVSRSARANDQLRGLVHDANHLFMLIVAQAEAVLASMPEASPARESIQALKNTALRGGTMIHGAPSPSDTNTETSLSVTDLNAVILAAEPLLRRLAGPRVRLAIELRASASIISVRPSEIERLLLNLVVNARNAMPQHGDLTIRTLDRGSSEGTSDGGDCIILQVTDTGCGMNEATRQTAMAPVPREMPARGRTGLGLLIVRHIVDSAGGRLNVRSELGAGTELEIRFPVSRRAESGMRPRVTLPVPAVEGVEKRDRVLVVEDDLAARLAYEKLLELEGFQVLLAPTAAEGLTQLRRHGSAVCAVLADFELPDADGLDLACALREVRADIPVAYVTGMQADHPRLRAALTRPGTALFQKPVEVSVIARGLRSMLRP